MLEILLNLFFTPIEKDYQVVNLKFESSLIAKVSPPPQSKEKTVIPFPGAESVLVADLDTGEFIYEKNPDRILPIASITKVMTGVLVLEEKNLEEIVQIPDISTEGAKMWLKSGEKISVNDLLYGLLVRSANDAALAFSIIISNTEEEFVKKMNEKALLLGLNQTFFVNSSGLDSHKGSNVSTARNLFWLSRYALKKEKFREIVATKEKTVFSQDKKIEHHLKTTNVLLGNSITGLKTGFTDRAGECVILLLEKEGKRILSVVLNSPDRFSESKMILETLEPYFH